MNASRVLKRIGNSRDQQSNLKEKEGPMGGEKRGGEEKTKQGRLWERGFSMWRKVIQIGNGGRQIKPCVTRLGLQVSL